MVPMFAVTGRFAVGCEGRRGGAEGHESHGTSALESPRRGEGATIFAICERWRVNLPTSDGQARDRGVQRAAGRGSLIAPSMVKFDFLHRPYKPYWFVFVNNFSPIRTYFGNHILEKAERVVQKEADRPALTGVD